MPDTATSISYLPMLLVSVSHSAVPDDSSFDTPAAGQVDYLSHEWREEDVWRSWRSMTRQKNAIANGIRLENASWRTWWKQRNKLKTISPETLNWCVFFLCVMSIFFCLLRRMLARVEEPLAMRSAPSRIVELLNPQTLGALLFVFCALLILAIFSFYRLKDSDVTWLYGPLHLGSNWTPLSTSTEQISTASPRLTPHPIQRADSTDSAALSNRPSPSSQLSSTATAITKKPILKHRSISQLLTLPASPLFVTGEDDIIKEEDEEAPEDEKKDAQHIGEQGQGRQHAPVRPPLLHTKSDTHISWRRPFRKDSPPRIIAEEQQQLQHQSSLLLPSSASGSTTGSEQDVVVVPLSDLSSGGASAAGAAAKKKHISFNTFVEQCIAIEKPKMRRANSMNSGAGRKSRFYEESTDDGWVFGSCGSSLLGCSLALWF